MRRWLSVTGFFGLLVALAPAGPAAAREPCGATFEERLTCWSQGTEEGTVRVTLDDKVPFDGDTKKRKGAEETLLARRDHLVVEVPQGGRTGPGGTALLVLAKPTARLVARDATIDLPGSAAMDELAALHACDSEADKQLCERLRKGRPLSGADLIEQGHAFELHAYTADGSPDRSGATSKPAGTSTSGKQGQDGQDGQSGKDGQKTETGRAGQNDSAGKVTSPDPDPVADTGWDTATQVLAVLCAVLVLLLALLLLLIRRSSQAVGTLSRRALVTQGVGGAGPAPAAPASRPRAPDEATTRLRVTPTARHGRRVANVSGPVRPAVVRTELHPQGYVEVDHVLYRAVWAEPGRPPPAPGQPVDVTEAGERDSDVLYAFPPTTRRHAKAARP
jgi:hypothetical protein